MACTDLDKAAPAAGDDRHLHEECGVFGIYSNVTADVASLAYYALYALQHRGQESAGIVVNDDGLFRSWRDVGLVSDVFPKERLRSLGLGNIAVGHVRYGTTGSDNKRNVQPILVNHYKGRMALAHNGNLTNSQELRLQLESQGSIFHTTTDSEVIAYIIVQERLKHGSIEEAVSAAMDRLVGAYSLVISSPSKLIAVRDPHGFRPLCMGRLKDGSVVFASESCGLDAVGASFERDILPGEIVVADKNGVKSDRSHCGIAPRRLCVFEFIYFARPDSVIDGSSVHVARQRAGAFLALEHPVQADIVIGCLPNTPGTAGLLTETRLRRMKQDALLVNVGRGTLLSTVELADVLADGHLSGAVLDVCDTEPLPPSSPLWGMENVLLTPHVSGRGFGHDRGTERLIWEIVMDNLARYLEGKKLRHIVDINRGY